MPGGRLTDGQWLALLQETKPSRHLHTHVNLLLTRRCNFECAQCMFAAGPRLPGGYMSNDTIRNILDTALLIRSKLVDLTYASVHDGISINLVGGEPTLDLDEFHRVAAYISGLHDEYSGEAGIYLEMTTNGWWLQSVPTLRKFMDAVRRFDDTGMRIRISDSPYHMPFRSKTERYMLPKLQYEIGDDVLYEMQEYYFLQIEETGYECPLCSVRATSWYTHVKMSGCGVEEDEWRDQQDWQMSKELPWSYLCQLQSLMNSEDVHMFVDAQKADGARISPVGRAKTTQIPAWQNGLCGRTTEELMFTFAPDGSVYDFCCNGGKVPGAGHARDGLEILENHLTFMQHLYSRFPIGLHSGEGRRCAGCSCAARQWHEEKQKTTTQRRDTLQESNFASNCHQDTKPILTHRICAITDRGTGRPATVRHRSLK